MRDRLSIIMPTVRGREEQTDAVIAAYRANTPPVLDIELIVVHDHPTVGEAWNAGAQRATGDMLHFAIDDASPHVGWYEAGMRPILDSADDDTVPTIPSPTLYFKDGSLEGAGTMGGGMLMPMGLDGIACRAAGILLMPTDLFRRVGPFLPIHYYSDDEWCWRAWRHFEVEVVACHGYAFTHHHHPVRRPQMQARSGADRHAFLAAAAGIVRDAEAVAS
jgi:hypothetical protein